MSYLPFPVYFKYKHVQDLNKKKIMSYKIW
jgi:hypothetical protein